MGGKLIDSSFARNCASATSSTYHGTDSNCSCDFSINLEGCPEERIFFTAFQILIPLTLLIVIISISFLYYRVKIKGQSVFFPATRERGLIRPRPQDSFHIAVGVFNFSQLLVSICLITGSFPNVTMAETIVYIPKLLGFACAVLYPISIIYSTPVLKQTTYSLRIQWNPNKIFVDILAIYLMIGPLLTIVPLTALAGYFADKNNHKANIFIFKIQAFVWSSWTIQYFITLSYVYYKLIFMLKGYIDILQRRRGENSDIDMKLKKLNSAARNLTWIVLAVLLIFFINSLEGITIGISYNRQTFTGFIFFISWYFTIPVLTFIGQMIFLYDILKSRKSPQHQNNNNTYDRKNNILSHLEENPMMMKKRNLTDLISDQSTTLFISTNNSDKKNIINSIEVKTVFVSSTTICTSTYETKSGSRENVNDFTDYYYLEDNDEGKVTTSPTSRKSWLVKKPIRSASSNNIKKDTDNKHLLYKTI